MKTYTFDEICESQDFNHDEEFVLKEDIDFTEQLKDAHKILEMVQDNRKMPHQHEDKQLRLYCLAERVNEYFNKWNVEIEDG